MYLKMEKKIDKKVYLEKSFSDSVVRNGKTIMKSNSKVFNFGHLDGTRQEFNLDVTELLKSTTFETQLKGLKALRKMSVRNTDDKRQSTDIAFIDDVIVNDLVPKIVGYLKIPQHAIQEEAAWTLTNLATGEARQVRYLLEAGAVDPLIALLKSTSDKVREKATLALGNMAGEGETFRNYILQKGVIDGIVSIFRSSPKPGVLQNTVWLLSVLCSKILDKYHNEISATVPYLRDLLQSSDDRLVAQCCWCLVGISFGGNERVEVITKAHVPPFLAPLFSRGDDIITPALQVVGNVAAGDEHQAQQVIEAGLLVKVCKMVNSSNPVIRRSACWTLSNLSAGSQRQVDAVINTGILHSLIDWLVVDGIETKREIVWTLRNVIRSGHPQTIQSLMNAEALDRLCQVLKTPDLEIIKVVLDSLDVVLNVGDIESNSKGIPNPMAVVIENCGGLEVLEALLSHTDMDVYRKTFDLMERYFNG